MVSFIFSLQCSHAIGSSTPPTIGSHAFRQWNSGSNKTTARSKECAQEAGTRKHLKMVLYHFSVFLIEDLIHLAQLNIN